MTDEQPKKRSKNEKTEYLEMVKDLIRTREVSSKLYTKHLVKCCESRVRSMRNGTAVDIQLPKFYDARKTAKQIDASESVLDDIQSNIHGYKELRRNNDNATTELERKIEKLRKLRGIQQRIEQSQHDDDF